MMRIHAKNRPVSVLSLSLLSIAIWAVPATAQNEVGVSPEIVAFDERREETTSVSDAWEQVTSPAWYDLETKALRALPIRNRAMPKVPSNWEWNTPERPSPTRRYWSPGSLGDLLVWTAIALTVAGLAIVIVRTLRVGPTSKGKPATSEPTTEDVSAERIEHLPFDLGLGKRDPLRQAQELYQRHQYGPATQYLYAYFLLRLDQNHHIDLERGKTNRTYLRELHRQPNLHRIVGSIMRTFEEFYFGHHEVSRETFESHWNHVDQFHNLVQVETAALEGVRSGK
jgi:hypothetical protein